MSRDLPLLRRLRHFLAGRGNRAHPRWLEHDGIYRQAVMIVHAYYVITLYLCYTYAYGATQLSGSTDGMELLWPVRWLEWTGLDLGGVILAHLYLAAGLLGALAWRSLAVRVLVSVALLMKAAEVNSFGSIFHSYHEWFWISVCFLFLPNIRRAYPQPGRARRMQFLLSFSAAPALILMFYTMSGLYKVWYATLALIYGGYSGFYPYAMANTLAWRSLQTGSEPLWAGLVLDAPLLGWPLYLGLYFVEVVAFAIFFRPVLHRLWGAILIAFHFGTVLFMDIAFSSHVLVNGLLFIMSPFAPRQATWREMAAAVPLLGFPLRQTSAVGARAWNARSGEG